MTEPAAEGILVALTCRVLGLARQPYCRWLAGSVTDSDLVRTYRMNALFDAHRDDPEFGYRYLAAEASASGEVWPSAPPGCCATSRAGGARSGRSLAVAGTPVGSGHRSTTTWCAASSPAGPGSTSCGWPTSPSTPPVREAVSLRSQGRLFGADRGLLHRRPDDL